LILGLARGSLKASRGRGNAGRSVQRFNQRQGFLVSLTLHLTILMMLINLPLTVRRADEIDPSTLERKNLVYMPPAAEIRKLLPPQARRPAPAPTPVPAPTPPPANQKNRISVGPPSDVRRKELILRREDDLTKVPKGERSPAPTPPPPMPTPQPTPVATAQNAAAPEKVEEKTGREGLKLPPGLTGQTPSGQEARKPVVGPMGPAISRAVDGVTQRALRDSRAGIPTGTGQNLSGLQFDPQGADFTLWVNRFKDEVYRNWIIPNNALFGASRGHVDFEFTVERNGKMSSWRMLKSSGTPSLDKAAEYALTGSMLLPLPDDFGPPRVTMQVSFHYNDEAPQGS
jgi:TonB family protein